MATSKLVEGEILFPQCPMNTLHILVAVISSPPLQSSWHKTAIVHVHYIPTYVVGDSWDTNQLTTVIRD